MKHVDLTPPENVAKAAAKGLKLRQAFNRGGTRIGVARARFGRDTQQSIGGASKCRDHHHRPTGVRVLWRDCGLPGRTHNV